MQNAIYAPPFKMYDKTYIQRSKMGQNGIRFVDITSSTE